MSSPTHIPTGRLVRLRSATDTCVTKVKLQHKYPTRGAYDLMVTGHARSAGLTLVTNHEREFGRVPGLMVENGLH